MVSRAIPFIEVRRFTKRYGTLAAIADVSFAVYEGEILGVIGPNGSGKTTLFECVGGVRPADKGTILREGKTLSEAERKATLFYLPDGIAPWPGQRLEWALKFAEGFFRGRQSLRGELVRALDLEELLKKRVGDLSKGQRKRALLGIGLLMPQPVLLSDEPFEGLDLRQTRHIASALRSYAGAGKRTLVLSIHQIGDAARVCDRFVLLSNGTVCGEGTLEELAHVAGHKEAGAGLTGLEDVFLALT